MEAQEDKIIGLLHRWNDVYVKVKGIDASNPENSVKSLQGELLELAEDTVKLLVDDMLFRRIAQMVILSTSIKMLNDPNIVTKIIQTEGENWTDTHKLEERIKNLRSKTKKEG